MRKDVETLLAWLVPRISEGPVRVSVAVPEHAGLLAALLAIGGGGGRISGLGSRPANRESSGSMPPRDAPWAGGMGGDPEVSIFLLAPTATLRDRAASVTQWLLAHGPVPRALPQWPASTGSPYDEVVESPFVVASRLGCLGTIALGESPFLFAMDAASAATRVMPFERFLDACVRIEVGREMDLTALVRLLVASGYRRCPTVAEVGEFAVRGGILDVFSPGAEDPIRVELDGDVVASLKAFDAATQRALRPLASSWLFPAWEVPADPEALRAAFLRLQDLASARGVPTREVARIEDGIREARLPPGFAGVLRAWHGALDLVWSYLPEGTVVVILDPAACRAEADAALDALASQYREVGRRLCEEPSALRASGEDLLRPFAQRPYTVQVEFGGGEPLLGTSTLPLVDQARITASEIPVTQRVAALCDLVRAAVARGDRVLIPCPTEAEVRRVRDILTGQGVASTPAPRHAMTEVLRAEPGVRVGVGRVRSPFSVEALGLLVIPSESVFEVKDAAGVRRERGRGGARWLREYRDLEPGSLVIHRDHGLGRFAGLQEVRLQDGSVTECLVVTYQGGDRLLVPVDRVHLLERYVAPTDGEPRPLDRLGGQVWRRRKQSARRAAREIAEKLKAIYAKRLAGKAHAFDPPDAEFREFEATFPYETTPDQDRAIEEVLEDLTRERPMDRLVCGDVGFGKTEVAVRAAYLVAMGGKQVAVLVPTTLLAEQHRLTFAARLNRTPVIVESLSRFKSPAEVKRVLDGLKSGGIDIVIGTHRLLSSDVVFRDLGLLIVDEEHRFGVSHKERLREIAATVHTLTLSATPIPRTLHMALSGIRELSVIATPPRDRLAVKTVVARKSRDLVRAAILRELKRGGQVFFVHNRVEDIYEVASQVAAMVPEARVTVAHGQMSSTDLEAVMTAFVRGEKDVLVCTTIVQSGLDIATANTILVHDAASLGLADLYQLRGRVGRGSDQAWCYLLVDDPGSLSGEARRRIEAIERFSELASGFHIAALDLEIRGAGTLLGAEQSGHMAAVGFDLFLEMVYEAVREATGEEVEEPLDPEVHIGVEARLPASYVPDEATRLRLYRRLAGARDIGEVASLASELRDRFGPLPEPARNLLALLRVKVLARGCGLAAVTVRGGKVEFLAAAGREGVLVDLSRVSTGLGLRPLPESAQDRAAFRLPEGVPALAVVEAFLDRVGGRDVGARA